MDLENKIPELNFDAAKDLSKDLEIADVRQSISEFETEMRNLDPSAHVEIKVKNHFSKDIYAREIFIPKGTYVVGKIHKFENLNILSKGEMSLISIEGCKRIKAPFTIVSPPGVKRLAYAHEDCIWTTVHGTNETDVEKIEEIFIAKNYEDVCELEKSQKILED